MASSFKDKLSNLGKVQANVWLIAGLTIATLAIVVFAANASGHPILSSAANLTSRVNLIDENGNIYPDAIAVDPGAIIQVGWKAYLVSGCQSSGWTGATGAKVSPVAVGPFTNTDSNLSVTCQGKRGPVSASVNVHINGGDVVPPPVSDTSKFSSPQKGDVWRVGQTYTIRWQSSSIRCDRADLGCDANPAIDTPAPTNTSCNTNSVSGRFNQNCDAVTNDNVPVQVTNPATDKVSITLGPQAGGATSFVISANADNSGSFTWTIPASLSSTYIGSEQITITPKDGTFSRLTSDVFTIAAADTTARSVITVLAPNGGEQWQQGTSQNIRWSGPSSIGQVKIDLVSYVPPGQARASVIYHLADTSSRSFAWTVGTSGPDSRTIYDGQYLIIVSDNAGNSGTSAAPFTILSKSVTPYSNSGR